MGKIEAVIFDIDGLMFDTEKIFKKTFKKVNKQFNLPLNEEYRQSICGKTEKSIREDLQKRFPNVNIDEYRKLINSEFQKSFLKHGAKCKKGLKFLINFLLNKKIKLAIASGNSLTYIKNLLKTNDIDIKIFDCIISGDDNIKSKPSPNMYLTICKRINCQPQKTIVLEDSPNGILGAYEARCLPIMIPDLIKPTKEIEEKCYLILSNLKEVKRVII